MFKNSYRPFLDNWVILFLIKQNAHTDSIITTLQIKLNPKQHLKLLWKTQAIENTFMSPFSCGDRGNYPFLLCINGPFEMHGMFPFSKF